MEVVVTPTLPQRLPRRKKKTKVRESLEDHLNLVNLLKIIGLSFAGSTTGSSTGYKTIARACRIDRVAEELNIEAFTGQTVNFSDKTDPQVRYELGFSSLSAVTINGDKYYQVGTVS